MLLLDSGHFCFGKGRGGDVDSVPSDGAPGWPRGACGNDCATEPLACQMPGPGVGALWEGPEECSSQF